MEMMLSLKLRWKVGFLPAWSIPRLVTVLLFSWALAGCGIGTNWSKGSGSSPPPGGGGINHYEYVFTDGTL
jgi:hypothetical protein